MENIPLLTCLLFVKFLSFYKFINFIIFSKLSDSFFLLDISFLICCSAFNTYIFQNQTVEVIVLDENKPIVLHLRQKQTRPKARIVKVIPALTSLKNNVRYSILSGNQNNVFSMHRRRGISSLHFTQRINEPSNFELEIECKLIRKEEKSEAESSIIKLILHVN